jgi:hypothetical protein
MPRPSLASGLRGDGRIGDSDTGGTHMTDELMRNLGSAVLAAEQEDDNEEDDIDDDDVDDEDDVADDDEDDLDEDDDEDDEDEPEDE